MFQGKTLVLPPSILLGGTVSTPGDVVYHCLNEEVKNETPEGATSETQVCVKTTEKIVRNVEEQKIAQKLGTVFRKKLRTVCKSTILGLVCRRDDEEKLDLVLSEIRKDADDFNATATHHRVRVSLIKATIASNDEYAARELVTDIQTAIDDLKDALEKCDTAKISEVTAKLKAVSVIMPDAERGLLEAAFKEARKASRVIKKSIKKKQMEIEQVKGEFSTAAVDIARSVFLEYIPSSGKDVSLTDIASQVAAEAEVAEVEVA